MSNWNNNGAKFSLLHYLVKLKPLWFNLVCKVEFLGLFPNFVVSKCRSWKHSRLVYKSGYIHHWGWVWILKQLMGVLSITTMPQQANHVKRLVARWNASKGSVIRSEVGHGYTDLEGHQGAGWSKCKHAYTPVRPGKRRLEETHLGAWFPNMPQHCRWGVWKNQTLQLPLATSCCHSAAYAGHTNRNILGHVERASLRQHGDDNELMR